MAKEDLLISVRMDTTQARAELRRLLDEIKRADKNAKVDADNSLSALKKKADAVRGMASTNLTLKENRDSKDSVREARAQLREFERDIARVERKLAILGPEGPVQAAVRQKILPTKAEVRQFLRTAGDLAASGDLKDFEGPTKKGAAGVNEILRPLIPRFTEGLRAQGLLQDTPAQKVSRQERLAKEQQVNAALRERTNIQRTLNREQKDGNSATVRTLQRMVDNEQKIRDLTGRFTHVARFTRQLEAAQLQGRLGGLPAQLRTLEASEEGRALAGLSPTRTNIATQMGNIRAQQRILGTNAPTAQLDELRTKMERLVNVQKRYAAEWDTATKTFTHHALRIAEGLILYNAFTKVLEGLSAAFGFTAQVDKDTTRLGQVLVGLSATETDKFLHDLGGVAIETATDFRELLGVTDLVAGAFRGLRTDAEGVIDTQGLLGDVEGMSSIIGEFTNVLGGANTEQTANQLVSLFRITKEGLEDIPELSSLEPLERFRAFMDSVVTLGHRSAFEINQLSDGLLEAGLNANVAGFDLRLLTAVMDQMIFATGQSGREIGTLLRTSLSKLSDPKVLDGFQKIVEGAFSVRDATGELREADDILVSLFEAVRSGALTAEQSREALGELIPPLNPGAVGFNNALIDSIGGALLALAADSGISSNALEKLSLIIANTLPGRFQAFQSRIQTLLLGFTDSIEETTEGLLGFGNTFLGILESIGPETTTAIIKFLAFAGGAALLITVLSKLKAVFVGMGQGFMALVAGAQAAAASTTVLAAQTTYASTMIARMSGTMTAASVSAGTLGVTTRVAAAGAASLRVAAFGLGLALKTVLPLAIAFAALEIGGQLLSEADQIRQLSTELGILNNEQAEAFVHAGRFGALPPPGAPGRASGAAILNQQADVLATLGINIPAFSAEGEARGSRHGGAGFSQVQARNLEAARKATIDLAAANELTDASFASVIDTLTNADGSITRVALSSDDLFASAINAAGGQDVLAQSLAQVYEQLGLNIDGSEKLTAAQLQSEATTLLMTGLNDDAAQAIANLNEQYKNGEISLEEFNSGLGVINTSQQQAADLVAGFGERLRTMIPELANADAGADGLSSALFDLILKSSDSSGAIGEVITRLVALAITEAEVAATIAANPIQIHIITTTSHFDRRGGFLEGDDFGAGTVKKTFSSSADLARKQFEAQEKDLIDTLMNLLRTSGGAAGFGGSGGGAGAGAQPPSLQRSIMDVGELSTAQVQQAIQMAIALQNKIPGAAKDAANEFISLLRDAKLVRNLKGVDNRLLQEAIDQLTEEMKKANELAQAENAVMKNLQVNAGPFAALVSQPLLFGAGGSIPGGVNFDPNAPGQFVVNIDIGSLSQMSPAEAAALIEQAVKNAIKQGLKLSGNLT